MWSANYNIKEGVNELKYYYPVSPNTAIIINGEKDLECEKISDVKTIKLLNRKMLDAHDRFVFDNSKELLENVLNNFDI